MKRVSATVSRYNNTDLLWRYRLVDITRLTVRQGSAATNTTTNDGPSVRDDNLIGSLSFFGQYRPSRGIVASMLAAESPDIVVFDHGLHYNLRAGDKFVEDMKDLLDQLFFVNGTTKRNLRLVAWRETSAQHFNKPDGYFSGATTQFEESQKRCVRIAPSEKGDAHFCSTPYMWLPVWRSLRIAMDRTVSQLMTKDAK